MNKENNKQDYLAPTLKVVEFKVERGFAVSLFDAKGALYEEQQMLFYDGTEEYQVDNEASGWFN